MERKTHTKEKVHAYTYIEIELKYIQKLSRNPIMYKLWQFANATCLMVCLHLIYAFPIF